MNVLGFPGDRDSAGGVFSGRRLGSHRYEESAALGELAAEVVDDLGEFAYLVAEVVDHFREFGVARSVFFGVTVALLAGALFQMALDFIGLAMELVGDVLFAGGGEILGGFPQVMHAAFGRLQFPAFTMLAFAVFPHLALPALGVFAGFALPVLRFPAALLAQHLQSPFAPLGRLACTLATFRALFAGCGFVVRPQGRRAEDGEGGENGREEAGLHGNLFQQVAEGDSGAKE